MYNSSILCVIPAISIREYIKLLANVYRVYYRDPTSGYVIVIAMYQHFPHSLENPL